MKKKKNSFGHSQISIDSFNPFPNKSWFLHVCVTSNFFFSHSIFYPFGELSPVIIRFEKSRLQTLSLWKSPKFVFWDRVDNNT